MSAKHLSLVVAAMVLLLVPTVVIAKGTFRFDDRYKAYLRSIREEPKPIRNVHAKQPGIGH